MKRQRRSISMSSWVFLLSLMLGPAVSFGSTNADASFRDSAKKKEKKPKWWSAGLYLEHYQGTSSTTVPFSMAWVDLMAKVGPDQRHHFRVLQTITRPWRVAEVSGQSVVVDDPLLYYSYQFMKWKGGSNKVSLRARAAYTAPLSEETRRLGYLGSGQAMLNASFSLLDGRIQLSVRPFGRYHFARYTADPDGDALRRWSLGSWFTGVVRITEQLSLSGMLIVGTNFFYPSFLNSFQRPQGTLSTQAAIGYSFTSWLGVRVGGSYGEDFTQFGRIEPRFFDLNTGTVFAGLDFTI